MADELRRASRAAFEGAVELAISERVDAVLIAGDLFDGDRLSVQTERFLHEALSRLDTAKIQVVYATGNHDPGNPSGPVGRVRWPENVHLIAGPEPVSIEILRDGSPVGRVVGAGHATSHVTEDLSRRFPRPGPGLPQVALLHTQVLGSRGSEGHEPYAPSELGHLLGAGFDYWALGHVHVRQELASHPPIHYPGNPQGRNPRETGAKGGLLVDLSRRDAPRVEFVELGPVRWETLRVDDLEGDPHLPALARHLERRWDEVRGSDPGRPGTRWIARFELEGPTPLHRELRDEGVRLELSDALRDALGLLDVDVRTGRVQGPIRAEDHRKREDVLGEALRLVTALSDPAGPSPSDLLRIDASQLAGTAEEERDRLDAYLRSLLEGGEALLLEALLRGDP